MKDNRMDNIVECAYNMDNGYVEVWFTDGNMLRIKCEEVEAALRTTEQSLAKLHRLLNNKSIEYVAMALSGEMQAYCDIEDNMVKGMFGTIVHGYLKKGYNRATAEMMVREFLGMRVEKSITKTAYIILDDNMLKLSIKLDFMKERRKYERRE